MRNYKWDLAKKNSLRYYHYKPLSSVELMFTTRRKSGEDVDHNFNIERHASVLGIENMVVMEQTHSDKIVRVDTSAKVEADGCFTTQAELALTVRVADCVPLFIWSQTSLLIGIVHAGWRGTLAKISLRFIEKVEKELGVSPHHLNYALGPSIGGCCYKVGEDLYRDFKRVWPDAERFFSKKREGLFLDLRAANRFLMNSVGAVEAASLDLCTGCDPRRHFYSYRREPGKGRNWGIIIKHV